MTQIKEWERFGIPIEFITDLIEEKYLNLEQNWPKLHELEGQGPNLKLSQSWGPNQSGLWMKFKEILRLQVQLIVKLKIYKAKD